MTHEKMTIVVGARPERLSRFIVAVSEQHLADVRFGPHYGLKAAVAAGPKSAIKQHRAQKASAQAI